MNFTPERIAKEREWISKAKPITLLQGLNQAYATMNKYRDALDDIEELLDHQRTIRDEANHKLQCELGPHDPEVLYWRGRYDAAAEILNKLRV